MTQKQLAKILHVSDKSVSRWENGVTMPDISLLIPLSDALHIPLVDLLSGISEVSNGESLLKETIQMSTDLVGKQRTNYYRTIMTLMVASLFILLLAPWCIDPKDPMNLSAIDPPGFYVVLAEMVTYCIMLYTLDQKIKAVNLICLFLLVLNVCVLIRDLLVVVRELTPRAEMTLFPVTSCIFAVLMIAAHFTLFTMPSLKTGFDGKNTLSINQNNGHLVLFSLAIATIIFVSFAPVVDYSGVSYRTLLEAFVEKQPKWIGNYHSKDYYNGTILTCGYVSLLTCPLFCLWAKLRNRAVFLLTNISFLHIIASIINYPVRFEEVPLSWLTPAYIISCSLPVASLILLYAVFFKPTFMASSEKKTLAQADLFIQLAYLVLAVIVFSYIFIVVPFFKPFPSNKGEWHLMNALSVVAIMTLPHIVSISKKNRSAS